MTLSSLVFACVTVLSVHDGDTFTVSLPKMPEVFSPISVRIAGIDAPEMDAARPCERRDAIKAREVLTELLRDECVTLREVTRDKYFRLLARVQTSHDVADVMLLGGYATPYSGTAKKPWKCSHSPRSTR